MFIIGTKKSIILFVYIFSQSIESYKFKYKIKPIELVLFKNIDLAL